MAVGKWQSRQHHAHDRQRCAESEGIQERDASHGRRPALSFRSPGRCRLCMGAGPPEECPLTKGEIVLSPMISRTFSTKSGSAESLKVSVRCGCKPKAFQMPWIVEGASEAEPTCFEFVRQRLRVNTCGRPP